ncbi:short-chain dehydrogenase [Streptomyces sparsogenes DSM 40356]|uniref:Short-chain dehydrogenase n=1 Tax=Streptomyces sparsogenes DSM 40356 TaxID=1331668 RepID=A0A1R1S9M7_9ACTN|nr:short-chain dehydrogenase [Streptomyces sparsogenes DSM 40356]
MTPTAASAEASEFAGKTALVTGAARGVGKETVALLHARGARVVAVDLRPDVTTLGDEFPGVLAMRGDLPGHAEPGRREHRQHRVLRRHGRPARRRRLQRVQRRPGPADQGARRRRRTMGHPRQPCRRRRHRDRLPRHDPPRQPRLPRIVRRRPAPGPSCTARRDRRGSLLPRLTTLQLHHRSRGTRRRRLHRRLTDGADQPLLGHTPLPAGRRVAGSSSSRLRT